MIENTVPWPNGARCAVAITFDIDTDSFIHLKYGNRVPDMVSTTSWLRYDEIAIPRILKMYKDHGIRQTFFYPAWCMNQYPHLVDKILKDGHEIAHHGYLHESPNKLEASEENYWIERGIETIEKMTGRRPKGFRAPNYDFSRNTASILADQGFLYDASLMINDVPCQLKTESGVIIELPSHWALDDWPQYVHNIELEYVRTIRSPDEAMSVYLAEFEAMYKYGGLWVAAWHPWVSGRVAQCDRISNMIEYMQGKGDVWFATMEEIANHVQMCISNGDYDPAIVKLPFYRTGIPDNERPQENKFD